MLWSYVGAYKMLHGARDLIQEGYDKVYITYTFLVINVERLLPLTVLWRCLQGSDNKQLARCRERPTDGGRPS
jgi:hypothetical protein